MAKRTNQEELAPVARKPRNTWGTIRRFINYMSNKAWLFLLVIIFALITVLLSAQAPRVMGNITTIIYEGIQEGINSGLEIGQYPIDFEAIRLIIIQLALLYIASAVFRYLQQFLTTRVAQHTVYDLRKDLKQKMGQLPISYFDTHSNGDILSRAVNDMDQISNALGQTLTQIIRSVVQVVAVFFTMLFLNVPLTLIVLLSSVPLSIGIIAFIAPRSQRYFGRRQNELGNVNDFIEEIYSGHTAVKTYNQEEAEFERFEGLSDKLNESSWKAEAFAGVMNPFMSLASNVSLVLVAVVGGLGVYGGSIQIGIVQSFFQYVKQFNQPFRQMANVASTLQLTIAAVERVFELLDEEEMVEVEGGSDKVHTPYKVEFDRVQFGYEEGSENLLMTDFNLQVKEGEMIAIVGPTGAGKSTLINLLERFYDVSGGGIYYEGKDIRNIDREDLREEFSMVLQETWLFNGTIWENLKYGAEDISDENILTASKAAHVHDFVQRLPQGYDTMVTGDGTNLSQGQQQLITIARAFLQDPEVLILDEATSSVDTRTEILIQRAIDRLLEGRTSFVVAHRLSTIRDADKIVVMDQGDVIESGSHEQLMDKDGFYARLYNAQFA